MFDQWSDSLEVGGQIETSLLFYCCSWKRQTYVTRRPSWAVSKNTKLGVGGPPLSGNLGSKFQLWTPISPPPRGIGLQFLYRTILNHG